MQGDLAAWLPRYNETTRLNTYISRWIIMPKCVLIDLISMLSNNVDAKTSAQTILRNTVPANDLFLLVFNPKP